MKTKILSLVLCFLMIKAMGQNNLTIKTYNQMLNGFAVKLDANALNSVFTNVYEDGVKLTTDDYYKNLLSNLPTTLSGFGNPLPQVVFVGGICGWGSISLQQANTLIDYVKQGGILIGLLENVPVDFPNGVKIDANKYIGEALFCNQINISTTICASYADQHAKAYHAGNGILLLNSNGANICNTTNSLSRIGGIPSENAIFVDENVAAPPCEHVEVLDFIVPAYPGLLGSNHPCGVNGFAILSGEGSGPLSMTRELTPPINANYAQLIYDFLYNPTAMANRNNWSNTITNTNPNCPPTLPNCYATSISDGPQLVVNNITNTCPNATINLHDYEPTASIPTGATIVWFNNPIHSGMPLNVTNAVTGIYYAFFYYPSTGCYSSATKANVFVHQCNACTQQMEITTPTVICGNNGEIFNTSFSGNNWVFNDIQINGIVNITDAEVLIEPNVQITVVDGGQLNIKNSHFYTCNGTWQGIRLLGTAKLNIDGTNSSLQQKSSFIEDAEIAIYATPPIIPEDIPTYGSIYVNNTIFNRNNIAIKVEDYSSQYYNSTTYPLQVKSSLFTCRNIPFTVGANAWDNFKTVAHCQPSYPHIPIDYTEPYIINANYPDDVTEAFLKDPVNLGSYTTNKPLAGIVLSDINAQSTTGGFAAVKIGDEGGVGDYGNTTIFDNLGTGIDATATNLMVRNCSFQKPRNIGVGININNEIIAGGGIIPANARNNFSIDIATSLNKPNNAFYAMNSAIVAQCGSSTTINDCYIISNQDINNASDNTIAIGKKAIDVTSGYYKTIDISHNKIINIRNGISFSNGISLSCTGEDFNSGTLTVNDNKFYTNNGTAQTTGNEYIEHAIHLASSGVGGNIPNTITCNNNYIEAYNGIGLSGWFGKTFNILSDTINLTPDININPESSHYGIKAEGGYGSSFGYDDNGVQQGSRNDNLIQDNIVVGAGISNTPKKNNAAIWLRQQANTNLGCNHVSNTDHGFKFEGTNLLTKFMDNFIAPDNFYGLTLWNGGEIGKQGQESIITPYDPNTCTSNNDFTEDATFWNNQSHFMTNTFKSDPLNSVLVVRTGGYEKFNPAGSGNAAVFGQIYNVNNGLLTATYDGGDCDVDRCGNHPIARPTKHNLFELLDEIAAGTATLPNDEPLKRLEVMQQQLFELVKARPELAQNSTDIQQFIYDNQWNSFDFIYYVGYYATKRNMAMVNALLNYWTPTNSELDNNYHTYYEWLVTMYNNPNWHPDIEHVKEMANKCPLKEGTIIYAARNLYNALTKEIHKFDNTCEGNNTNARGASQQAEIIRLKQPKTKAIAKQESKSIVLFPNPANAIVNINSKQDAIKQIEIVDMMGKTIKTIAINNQINTQFNTTGFQKGLFLVKITTANNVVTTQKLIVE